MAIQDIQCDFIEGSLVTEADLEGFSDPNGGQTIIIIDDNSIAAASSKEIAHVFTMARHKNCIIVLLLHFIFGPWPSNRIISNNTAYFFLMKSPRMAKQVSTLGSQIGKQGLLVSAYEREMRKPYGYVLVDLCTNTPDHQRIRTNIFDILSAETVATITQETPKAAVKQEPKKRPWIEWEGPPSQKKHKADKMDESVNQESDENKLINDNNDQENDEIESAVDDSDMSDEPKKRIEDTDIYKHYRGLLRRRRLGIRGTAWYSKLFKQN